MRNAAKSAAMSATLLAAGLVGACGVKGPLDPPSQAQTQGAAQGQSEGPAPGTTKSAEAGAAGENTTATPKPHEPFVLDGLLR